MKITICIGSSCHLKGSRQIVEELQRLVAEKGLKDKIELAGKFCMGNCQNGVSLKADEVLVHNANKDNCEELFLTQVLPRVK